MDCTLFEVRIAETGFDYYPVLLLELVMDIHVVLIKIVVYCILTTYMWPSYLEVIV